MSLPVILTTYILKKKITLTKTNMPLVFLVNKIVFILNTSLASDISRKYQDLNNLWAKD